MPVYNLKLQAELVAKLDEIWPHNNLSVEERHQLINEYVEARLMNQPWIDEWLGTPLEPDQDSIDWIRSRPDSIKALMLRFPPSSLVRANRSLQVPAPDSLGIVQSYFEDDQIGVIQHPNGLVRAQCQAVWLELIACKPPCTVEWVKKILEEI